MRLRRLKDEFAGALDLQWRSFLLRPEPGSIPPDLEAFRDYTRSWLRAAAQPDAGVFRVWASQEGPPSHSVPPHLAAKAAASLGPEAFDTLHGALLRAYFAENRDITRRDVLAALWVESGLPPEEFGRIDEPRFREQVFREHDEAVAIGIPGVPAVRVAGDEAAVIGAQPIEIYRRWVRRLLGEPE